MGCFFFFFFFLIFNFFFFVDFKWGFHGIVDFKSKGFFLFFFFLFFFFFFFFLNSYSVIFASFSMRVSWH